MTTRTLEKEALLVEKQKVLEAYLSGLDKKIRETEKALDSIYEGVYTAPKPSESHSDTTRSQQSKLAIETERRLSSLKSTRAAAGQIFLQKVICPTVGALIAIEDIGFREIEYYFVVPGQGGESLFLDKTEIMFISLQSPILEAVSGTKEGDSFDFRGRKLRLVAIS
ncbi:hypothetical protein KKC00_02840 [Patescibacteria group bacterium]|nr:hypothetical protein [Patescibacteria group bacterium]